MKNQINISKLFKCAALAVPLFLAKHDAFAVPVTFNLRDVGATAEIESGIINRGGIKATLTAAVVGSSGALNQIGSAFGINAIGSDSSSELDSAQGAESISIRFDTDVVWKSLVVSSFGSGEQGSITIGSFSPTDIIATGTHNWSANNLLMAGEILTLKHVAGSGFSFDSFIVEKWTAPISTPDAGSSIALLGVALGGLGFVVRRRSS